MKNTFGSNLSLTIFGESHGRAIGAVLDGMAAGVPVDEEFLALCMDKRRARGDGLSTPRVEADKIQFLSGVLNGRTTGTAIALMIENQNTRSGDYAKTADLLRPGHADYTAYAKYHGFQDARGGGHFSGRITAALVAGGGIVLGGVVLLSGEPGVGKSTMLLQLCGAISNQHSVLYITGEESVRQVKLRAARLKVPQENIYLAAENDVDEICGLIEKEKPELVVIDSIQTMRCMDLSSSAGTVSQVKESAARLLAVAKKQEIPMFIVGHVNKDGAIAGPKVMEHIVDTVLYFEGDKMLPYRILRAAKNRYGSTNELGMFDMTGTGLAEIENPSQMLLEGRPLGVSGNCVACTMEGSRPILSEIQALATKTNFPAPRRACSGYDYNRMNLLIAVLEKRAGYFFGNLDVYVNIVGGIALRDTACDLAVCLSMVSSLLDRPVSDKLIAIGEVGLGGEVRSVPNLEQRLHEAERIGFERAVIPKHSLAHLNAADYPGMKLVGAAYIADAINALKNDRL